METLPLKDLTQLQLYQALVFFLAGLGAQPVYSIPFYFGIINYIT